MHHESSTHPLERSIHVLLVDGDPDSAENTAQLLLCSDIPQSVEYKIVNLLSEALTELSQSHYDIILLDTYLADMPSPYAIQLLRDAFTYAPIIATSKIDNPELASIWVGNGADDCLFMGVVNEKALGRVVLHALKRSQTNSELQWHSRTHHILNTLLSLSLQEIPIKLLLQECLEVILSAPFTEMLHQGGIFVTEKGDQKLKLFAHSNLNQEIIELCNKVPFGHCLCGRAAQSQKIQYATCVDHRHEIEFDGMHSHGHYNVPILSKGKVLGVMVLYLRQGHSRTKDEEEFLRGVSDTLAGIIERAHTSEQLVLANEQNSRLLSSLTSILIGVDSHDCISHWNEAAEQTFGMASEEVLGRPIVSSPINWDWGEVSKNILMCQTECK